VIAVAVFGGALHDIVVGTRARARKLRSRPSAVDAAIGAAVLKEAADSIAGDRSKDMAFATTLIAFALLAHSARPAVEGSVRAVQGSLRSLATGARRLRAALAARYESRVVG
jgi:hypothetical protein